MITGAATATVNRLPLLHGRQRYPKKPHSGARSPATGKPAHLTLWSQRLLQASFEILGPNLPPEQLLTALPEAMRAGGSCPNGAVTLCLLGRASGEL